MEYNSLFRETRHQYSKWDISPDLIYTSCGKYSLCPLGRLYPFHVHKTTFWRNDDYLWFPFGLNSDDICNSNRCMLVLVTYRRFTRHYRGHFGLSSSSQYSTGVGCSGTILHSMGNIPWMHLSTNIVPIKVLTANFLAILSQIWVFRSSFWTSIGMKPWKIVTFFVDVLNFGYLRHLMWHFHWASE